MSENKRKKALFHGLGLMPEMGYFPIAAIDYTQAAIGLCFS